MEIPVTHPGQSVRFGFSFSLKEFNDAIDRQQLLAESNISNEGLCTKIPVPERGFPLVTGNRGLLGYVSGEPGPRQGNATVIMVGDKDHFRNVPPRPKVRLHSGCSFSLLGKEMTLRLLERSKELTPGPRLADQTREMLTDLNFFDLRPTTDCDCRAQGRSGLQTVLGEGGVFF